ncbi:MAG: hypothetical protein K2K59_05360, partial [Muribaculaceae bacterium]|nr:hypothetical protein [Muribaculaceae bacterium]
FIVYGLWFMVYGLWFIVYGLWLRVYCLGFMGLAKLRKIFCFFAVFGGGMAVNLQSWNRNLRIIGKILSFGLVSV